MCGKLRLATHNFNIKETGVPGLIYRWIQDSECKQLIGSI